MKILFLDIDGVLNSEQSSVKDVRAYRLAGGEGPLWLGDADCLCPIACSNLRMLMESCDDLNIVISSSWRILNSMDDLRQILQQKCGIAPERVLDKTPSLRSGRRGNEIQAWLDENTKVPEGSPLMPKYSVDDFMIIDDDSDMEHLKETNFLRTDSALGMTIHDTRKLLRRFKVEKEKWYPHDDGHPVPTERKVRAEET